MGRPASTLAHSYIGHLTTLERTRSKMEQLLDAGLLARSDVEQVYAGLYLEAITSFESFLEDLLVGLLVGSITPGSSRIVPRVSFRSHRVARDVMLGGQRYVDWLPYAATENRAKAFLRGGLPFTSLSKADKEDLKRLSYIRNGIAHKSRHSKGMFERHVIGSLPLTPRERTPSGFLRSTFRVGPVQTRYELLAAKIASMAVKLCK